MIARRRRWWWPFRRAAGPPVANGRGEAEIRAAGRRLEAARHQRAAVERTRDVFAEMIERALREGGAR